MADQLPGMPVEIQCPTCEGEGRIPLGEHFVSREMAQDACEPAMEGMSMGVEFGPCPDCSGMGLIVAPDDRAK